MTENQMPTQRTRVIREPGRGVYDRETVIEFSTKAYSQTREIASKHLGTEPALSERSEGESRTP
jgi:hypothetical protein